MSEIQLDTDEYLLKVKDECKSFRNIIIYGAGRKAIALYDFIKENTDIKVSAFVVTSPEENKEQERGVAVMGIDSCPYGKDDTLVLIGVRSRWNAAVIDILQEHGYRNYITAPENIECLGKSDSDRLRRPVLQITTQIGCAINCRYCPQDTFIHQYKQRENNKLRMSFDDFRVYIDKTEPSVILEFAGFSEPFFNDDCIKMLKHAHLRGHQIELFTTLQGLTEEGFDEIKDIPFREVVLHLPDEDENSHIPLTPEYISLLKKVINTQQHNGKPFVDWGSCHGKVSKNIENFVSGKLRILTQLHDRAGNVSDAHVEITQYKRGAIVCSGAYLLNHSVLLPNGDVLLCDSDWGMRHVIGNLNNNMYRDILEGKEISRIREAMKMDDSDIICRKCCYAEEV